MDNDFSASGPLDDDSSGARARTSEARPLAADERARCATLAGRLQTELRRVVAALPEHARSATGMSRHLGVVRNTCQRIVSAINEPNPAPELLARLPGVLGLRQIADALRAAGISAGDVASIENSADQFQALLREMGGSQSRLAERIALTAEARGDSAALDANPELAHLRYRQQMFKGAALCTGRQCDAFVALHILRPFNDAAAGGVPACERISVAGVIRQIGRPDAVPFTMSSASGREPRTGSFRLLNETPADGHAPTAILDQFSSSPLPLITARSAAGRLIYTVDSALADTPNPIDVVTANRAVLRPGNTAVDVAVPRCTWGQPNIAARHLLFDVYAHREIVKRAVPSAEVQLVDPREAGAPDWSTRVPHGPRLELLGPGIENASSPAYSRHPELTRYIFEELAAGGPEWDPAEYVGYRISVPYPMWRCWYCVWFNRME